MEDVKARLEEKRRRVEALRQARQQRLQEKVQSSQTRNADDLVAELLGTPSTAQAEQPEDSDSRKLDTSDKIESENAITSEQSEPEVKKPAPVLELSSTTAVVNIPPESLELYSKGIQTDYHEPDRDRDINEDVHTPAPASPTKEAKEAKEKEDTEVDVDVDVEERAHAHEQDKEKEKELSIEERNRILHDTDFRSFISRSSRLVDRALTAIDEWDPFIDYSREEQGTSRMNVEKKPLDLKTTFSYDSPVTDIVFSPRHHELLAVAYAGEHSGAVRVWNTHTSSEPEFSFTSHSGVVSVLFHPFKTSLILGGAMSGQVMRWDMSAGKEMPVQRSTLSAATHSGPIFAIALVGVENAHSLFTADTNGRACAWTPVSLNKPTETLEILRPQGGQSRSVAATCMAFQRDEVNIFVCGAEDGGVYVCRRKGSSGTSGGVMSRLEAHSAPVCSIDYHPSTNDLIISAGMDWRVVLSNMSSENPKIVHAIEFADNVYDARWCPTNPSVFAVADGTGTLSLWNISEDVEEPVFKFKLPQQQQQSQPKLNKSGGKAKEYAFTCLRWSHDGKYIACGDSNGNVHYVQVTVSEESGSEGVESGAASAFEW